MTITVTTNTRPAAASQSSLAFNPNTEFGFTPVQGDVLAVVFQRSNEAVPTAPSGSWNLDVTEQANSAVADLAMYWLPCGGSEPSSYTWNFTSTTLKGAQFFCLHDSLGGTWTRDVAVGDNTVLNGQTSRVVSASGTLADPVEVIIAGLTLGSNPTANTIAINTGYTVVRDNAATAGAAAYLVTSAVTSLAPTFTWTGAVAYDCDGQLSFYLVPAPAVNTGNMLSVF